MRKLTFLLAVGILFGAVSLPAFADGTPVTPTPANAAPGNVAGQQLHWFAGTATAIGSSSLTVGVLWTGPNDGSLNGQSLNVAVTDHTRINGPRHHPIALADIQTGDLVAVRAAGDTTSGFTAAKVRVFCNCHWVGGTIASVTPGASAGTGSIGVAVAQTGPYDTVLDHALITIQVDASTVYLRGPHHARLGFSDLKIGEGVGVVFSADGFFKAPGFDPTKATFTAARVHVWPRREVPPPSTDAGAAAGTSAT
jgi:hypothetical protein